ncbi:MAG: biopolymer transporter ExbD [Candidatus Eisenbacteria bacterium]|nr:biopolymer transporter ExbD [Candidatus Eisenbacteria bacterium]
MKELRFTTRAKFLTGLDNTAMADIIFNLLIFFLLSSSFILQTGIKVNLPSSRIPEVQERRRIIVTVTRDERVFLNDKEVSWSALEPELKKAVSSARDKLVVIQGDKEISLGRTVQAMDLARSAGAERLALGTKPPKE